MKNLVIYGNNYLEVIKLIDEINSFRKQFNLIGFLNDLPEYQGKKYYNIRVLGGEEQIPDLIKKRGAVFFSNINSTLSDRKIVAAKLEKHLCQVVSLIHPQINCKYAKIGQGSILTEGCIVGTGAEVGNFLTARFGAIISHDVTIGNFVYLGPSVTLCGYSQVDAGVYIGAGATILPKVKIGKGSVIGAGSLVTKDVPAGVIAFGSPAKVVKKKAGDSYRGRGM